jgi:hypothetical protein
VKSVTGETLENDCIDAVVISSAAAEIHFWDELQ